MKHLKTKNCVICGIKATCWHGHVVAKKKMALGNYIDVKIIAGFCESHKGYEIENENGCYGDYNSFKMGTCIPLFEK